MVTVKRSLVGRWHFTRGLAALALLAPAAEVLAEQAAPAPAKPVLVIADFQSAAATDPRDIWIPTAAEEVLTWRLRRTPFVVTTPTTRTNQARREFRSDRQSPPPTPQLARWTGATHLVSAVCSGSPLRLELRLTLTDLATNEKTQHLAGPDKLMPVLDAATRWLVERFGAGQLEPELLARLLTPPTPSESALEYFARALRAVEAEQARDAIALAAQAVEYDIRFRPALLLLAQIEMRLSRDSQLMAIKRLRVVQELALLVDDPLDRIEAELTLGMLMQLGQAPEAAMIRFENALKIARASGDLYSELAAMSLLADHHLALRAPPELDEAAARDFEQQQFGRAAEWQRLVLAQVEKLGDRVAEIPAAGKLALIEERLGRPAEALTLHERTLRCAEEIQATRAQAAAWMQIGQWRRRQGQAEGAAQALRRCVALAPREACGPVHLALAEIHQAAQPPQRREALGELEKAAAIARQLNDAEGQLLCLEQIAQVRWDLGMRSEALAAQQEALDLAHALELPAERRLAERLEAWRR